MQKIMANRAGITLITATTTEAGVKAANEQCPDTIVINTNLPGIDVALGQLQANPATADIPVIALSNPASSSGAPIAFRTGVTHYLTTPLDVTLLLKLLDRSRTHPMEPPYE